MATTTNYGWSTPDDTALVKDGAAAIRTLGSSVDTTTKNLNPSTTLGDIEYRSSTANTNTRLGIGSTGQVLTVAGGVPSWATPAAGGGGKVLQVVSATTATSANITTGTYTDTNITATITPTASTSKILVIISAQVFLYNNSGTVTYIQGGAKLLRGATALLTNDSCFQIEGASVANYMSNSTQASFSYLDSPSTTSATTYKLQAKINVGTGIQFNGGSQTSVITLLEIGA
jgi:hypothetical protein